MVNQPTVITQWVFILWGLIFVAINNSLPNLIDKCLAVRLVAYLAEHLANCLLKFSIVLNIRYHAYFCFLKKTLVGFTKSVEFFLKDIFAKELSNNHYCEIIFN